MLKNLPIKLFALFLAAVFWIFVVSLENSIVEVPTGVPMQVFNQAADLAFSSPLPEVKLTVRTSDSLIARQLTAQDFEAYIDLRNVGAGRRRVPVSVTSRNPQVTVVKTSPQEIEIELEPIREKRVNLAAEIKGSPAAGFEVTQTTLSQNAIQVRGADSVLRKIVRAVGRVTLDGKEKDSVTRSPEIIFYDAGDDRLEGLVVDTQDLEVSITIIEVEGVKEVGVRPQFKGSATGVVKKIEVTPSVISIRGARPVLEEIDSVQTEPIDLADAQGEVEKKVKIILPEGVKLEKGMKLEVRVKVEVEGVETN